MRTYTYLEVQRNFSAILNVALTQDVIIKKKDGRKFRIIPVVENEGQSPFEISGINTDISTDEMLGILRESRVQT